VVRWRVLSVMFKVYAMPVYDAIIVSVISRMSQAFPALRLKAAYSFLETSQCTKEHNSVEVQENPDYER